MKLIQLLCDVVVSNVAVFSVFVACGIYGDVVGKGIQSVAYPTTTYVIAALIAIAGAVCILLAACCGK